MKRQQQTELGENPNTAGDKDRFLAVEMFAAPPLTDKLSGLEVEYCIALIYCHEAGKREATIGFDVEQGNQDLGFRGEVPVLFDVRPAVSVKLHDRRSTMAGRPSPDCWFAMPRATSIRRRPSGSRPTSSFSRTSIAPTAKRVLLPPGKFTRRVQPRTGIPRRLAARDRDSAASAEASLDVEARALDRSAGLRLLLSGDHHIHAAGCAHYTSPTEGVRPRTCSCQVKGEGLNVGCVLTWGPCFLLPAAVLPAQAARPRASR